LVHHATPDLHAGRRRLRSSRTPRCELPQLNLTFGQWAFLYMGPAVWNCLPQSLQMLVNTELALLKDAVMHIFISCAWVITL
jgi:hypothetical protein